MLVLVALSDCERKRKKGEGGISNLRDIVGLLDFAKSSLSHNRNGEASGHTSRMCCYLYDN